MEANETRTMISGSFFNGIMFGISVISLIQDGMGKDAYIEHVASNWAPARLTVPLALVIIVVTLFYQLYYMRRTGE